MNQEIRCANCRCLFSPDPRVKNQRYCGAKACQRARKNLWQRQKMATDPDYQENQRDCQRRWYQRHPDYWLSYRRQRAEYCRRNRLLQKTRDQKRRLRNLAKMDALKRDYSFRPGTYYVVPHLAKMDASAQEVLIIPRPYSSFCGSCKRGLDGL
jgi:hypothetical protein